jgi:hypothetical protein
MIGLPLQIVADALAPPASVAAQLHGIGSGSLLSLPASAGAAHLARLLVARLGVQDQVTVRCVPTAGAVHCLLVESAPSPAGSAGLIRTSAGSSAAQAAGADGQRLGPPPSGGSALPGGASSMLAGSSGAAAGSSGASSAAVLLAALLLLASPRILRRLLLVCERWLASTLALIPERPG